MRPRIPIRRWSLCCVAVLSLIGLGCSSKELQYPEDHRRIERIDAAVEQLRSGYVGKDYSAIHELMLPVGRLEEISRDIKSDFRAFQEISLDFSIDRIMIDGETADVFVSWRGQWKRKVADAGIRERGHGMFRWVGVQSILLKDAQGDLPFGLANRLPPPGS